MKLKQLLLGVTLIIGSLALNAQQRNQASIDAALAFGNGFSPALSLSKLWGVGKKGKFKIGTGVRFTYYQKSNVNAITAPAVLTSGEIGPQVLFIENILSNLDTLNFLKVGVGYINIPIHLQYTFNEKLEFGFNIDAIGFSFGKKQNGTFQSSASASLNNTSQVASPTAFNLLLISDNDLGSLNSELYGRYWLTEKVGLRIGASFQFIEYTTDSLLTFGNDRFRTKILQPFAAISIKI